MLAIGWRSIGGCAENIQVSGVDIRYKLCHVLVIIPNCARSGEIRGGVFDSEWPELALVSGIRQRTFHEGAD